MIKITRNITSLEDQNDYTHQNKDLMDKYQIITKHTKQYEEKEIKRTRIKKFKVMYDSLMNKSTNSEARRISH